MKYRSKEEMMLKKNMMMNRNMIRRLDLMMNKNTRKGGP